MEKYEARLSKESRGVEENGDDILKDEYTQMPKIELVWDLSAQDPDLLNRYFKAVRILGAMVDSVQGFYTFVPDLISSAVDVEVLHELPSQVKNKYVKCNVINGDLFITELGSGGPHASGVHMINVHVGMCNPNMTFDVTTGGVLRSGDGRKGYAPDLVITQRSTGDGTPPQPLMIIELEVSNRSIVQMRSDFLRYFDEPSVCVVGVIKVLPGAVVPNTAASPRCERALAVQWVRAGGPGSPVVLTQARDFGILEISQQARMLFSSVLLPAVLLPGVPAGRWDTHRHVPVAEALLPVAPTPPRSPLEQARAIAQYIAAMPPHLHSVALYGGQAPTLTFRGLANFLHNLPPGSPPINDLVLNLLQVFYAIQTAYG